jgi:hypothetical protein
MKRTRSSHTQHAGEKLKQTQTNNLGQRGKRYKPAAQRQWSTRTRLVAADEHKTLGPSTHRNYRKTTG